MVASGSRRESVLSGGKESGERELSVRLRSNFHASSHLGVGPEKEVFTPDPPTQSPVNHPKPPSPSSPVDRSFPPNTRWRGVAGHRGSGNVLEAFWRIDASQ